MSKIARQITALLLAHECLHMTRGNKAREIIDRILAPRTIKKSELDALRTDAANMAEAQAAYNYADSETARWRQKFEVAEAERTINKFILEDKISKLEAELNQYRQAEEVETKLDNDANRVALGRYYKVPSGGTWTWSGEPQFYGKGLASKLSATTLPAEVEPETCPVTEQPAESPSKWRDFLSCIGFKN